MPFALAFLGAALILVAIRNTHSQLGSLLAEDFTGSGGAVGFITWMGAILAIGALGYWKPLQIPSRMILFLIFLGLLIQNKGVFENILAAIKSPPAQSSAAVAEPPLPAEIPVHVTGTGGSGGGGPLGAILGGVKAVAGLGIGG